MTLESARPISALLMAEMAWVRELARALVRDATEADDIAQDTFLVAVTRRPAEDRSLRPWLARVVKNLARTRRRGNARRELRGATFEPDPGATPAELVERVELQRALADEVLALAEPYRSTVLLHFVEGLASADIARRLGIPDGTVRRRLKTALDQLRAALRVRTDAPRERGGWLAALVPLAHGPSPTTFGVLAVKKLVAAAVAVLLLLLLAFGVWKWRGGSGATDDTTRPLVAAGSTRSQPSGSRTDEIAAIPAWLAPAEAPVRKIAGRVVAHGRPVGGARVLLGLVVGGGEGEPPIGLLQPVAATTSAADGTFDFGTQPPLDFVVSASAADRAAVAVRVANGDPRAADHLVLSLGDCTSRMSGVIADASGGPIAKARISVAGLSGTESDANGHYSVCLWSPPRFGSPMSQVRIEAEHYGTVNHVIVAGHDLHRDFALVPEAVLVGRVTTRDGRAVAGARVIAMIEPSEIRMHTGSGWATSDETGAFRIVGLAPGAFQLTASAPGLATGSPVAVIARPAASSREIHLVVAPRVAIRGRVVMGGAGVAGETVTAVIAGGDGIDNAVTRTDGSFVLERMPEQGTITFVLASHDLVEPLRAVQIDGSSIDGVTLEVTARATIRGRVTRRGQPVAGATVLYELNPMPQLLLGPLEPTTTDATGAFTLEGVRPGGVRVAAYDSASASFSDWRPVDAVVGEARTLDLVLDRSGAVQGTIVDQRGKPVAGAHVAFDLANGQDDSCETTTGTAGEFDCTMLIGGDYLPTISPASGIRGGFAPATGARFALVHVPQDGTVTGVTIAIADERFVIAGRVVDDLGAPLPDVRVEAIGNGGGVTLDLPSAATDARGRFEIGNLAHGTYNLHARAADGSDAEVFAIAAGAKAVAITLARAGAIEGTLHGFATPPRVLTTSLTPDVRQGGWAIVDGTTFSQIGLPPGRYTVDARSGAEVDGQIVEVKPGETAHVALHRRALGKVHGTLTDLATHAPLAGFRCDAILSMDGQMSGARPDPSMQAVTDAAGKFVANAPIGRVRVLCFPPSGATSSAGGDVDIAAAGATTTLVAYGVHATFGNAPGDAGFMLNPMLLPLTVMQVVPNGPAAVAGLVAGDRLVAIDGASLQGMLAEGAMMLVANHKPGAIMNLAIERGGAPRVLEIEVSATGEH